MAHKILFVDDDPNIQRMVEIFLRDSGYQITFAKNGRSALKFIENEPFDLLITDIQMPELDGLSLAKAILEKGIQIPVIVVSAFGEENISTDKLIGDMSVINKPFDRARLIGAIEQKIKP